MSALSLHLLGPLAASLGEQPLPKFRTKSVQALLIYLVCQPEAQPRERLMTLLWPGLPQKPAQDNLRQTLYQLRKLIPEVDGRTVNAPVPFILADRRCIQINPEANFFLDAAAFTQLTGKQAITTQLEEAIALYRDDFLTDFYLPDSADFEAWALGRRTDLRDQALDVLNRLAEQAVEVKDYAQAEAYARRQLTLDDLREGAYRQLMRALAGYGRRSDALAQYNICHQRLQDELDAAPSAATTELYEVIRTEELGRGAGEQGSEGEEAIVRSHNLPRQPTPFIGREAELEALQALLFSPDAWLTTIVGSGGMGKTRLALALAERALPVEQIAAPFPDGVFFVPLEILNTADLIPSAIADALNLRLERGESQLHAYLHERRLLLILDNFEHLLGGAAYLTRLSQAAMQVKMLVTSRERLQILGEQVYPLRGLDCPPVTADDALGYTAVQLFLQTAHRSQPDLTLTPDDVGHLTQICHLVGGMPLALELAAAWVNILPLADIAAEIRRNQDLPETELRDIPARHRSLQAVFASSWRQLSAVEQTAFAQLSVFRGGFTRAAATAVTGISLRQLAALVNKSLLTFDQTHNRYRIHGLLRQFGTEKLAAETVVASQTENAHSRYFCDWLAPQLEPKMMKGVGQKEALETIAFELENLRAAWTWAAANDKFAQLAAMLNSLGWFYWWLSHYQEGQHSFQRILDDLAGPDGGTPLAQQLVKVRTLNWLARFTAVLGNVDLSRRQLRESQTLLNAPALNDEDTRHEQAENYLQAGYTYSSRTKRQMSSEQSLALFRKVEDPNGMAYALMALGRAERVKGRHQKARHFAEESLTLHQQTGNQIGSAEPISLLGSIAFLQNRYEEAENYARQGLSIAQAFNHTDRVANLLSYLGQVYLYTGRFDAARQAWAESASQFKQIDSQHFYVLSFYYLGFTCLHLGQYDQVAAYSARLRNLDMKTKWSDVIPEAVGLSGAVALARQDSTEAHDSYQTALSKSSGYWSEVWGELGAQAGAGIVELQLGLVVEGQARLGEALATAVSRHRQDSLLYALAGIAFMQAKQGQPERAVELYALASRYPFVGNSHWFADVVGRPIADLAAQLPTLVVEKAQTKGAKMDLWETANDLLKELTVKS